LRKKGDLLNVFFAHQLFLSTLKVRKNIQGSVV